MKLRKKHTFGRGVVFVLCAGLSVLFLLPTVLTVTNSFMDESELSSDYGMVFAAADGGYLSETVHLRFIPENFTLSHYTDGLFKSPEYLRKLWNSVLLVVPIVILEVSVAALAAYGFSRWRGKLRSRLFFFYMVLMLMPYQVTMVPDYLINKQLGLLNTRWAIILPGVFAPFSVFLLTRSMRRIPSSVIEAARIDGASEWDIFTKICLPECRSVLCAVAVLVFIDYWNMVEQPLILLDDPEMRPLSVFLSSVSPREIGLAFAMATVYMIPALALFLLGEKHLTEGTAASGSAGN